jgi:shikimate dehydrogenase
MITGAAKVAGVVGAPVAHSLSPLIHNAWIEALGLDAAYVPFAAPKGKFEAFVEAHRSGTLVGLNVTLPYKRKAYDLADVRSKAAEDAFSANVLLFSKVDGEVFADNTDGQGLIEALTTAGWRASAGPVLILGAGGAAAGAVAAMTAAGVTDVRVAARDSSKARGLFQTGGMDQWSSYGFDQLRVAGEDVAAVINATSAGLNGEGELPAIESAPRTAVFMDMVYKPLRTRFLKSASTRGHPAVDGLEMLIGQARPSFEAFFGFAPPPHDVVDVRSLCLRALGEQG